MRILVLNYEFPPIGGGGGSASASLCQALASRGHELRVLTSAGPGLTRRETRDGYLVRRVVTGRRSRYRASFFSMAAYIVFGLLPGLRLIADWRPSVLHAHFAVPSGVLARWLSRLTGVPYLVTAHLGDVPGGVPEKTGRWFRLVYRWTHGIWRNASAVVAVSEHTRQLALRHYPVSIEVIPNGVELKSIPAGEPPVGDPPRLIFAGRFQPQKNLPMLVRSLAAIKDLEWMCELVGDGPQATLVDRMLRELGLDQRVERTGWIDPAEVEARMHQSDILVMPSRSEGLPVIGIQALAAGLAIVATRVGGLTELVEDGVNGRSSDPGNEADFIEGLRWCLENRRRLSGLKRASRRKAAAYDLDTVAERYEQVLARVAG